MLTFLTRISCGFSFRSLFQRPLNTLPFEIYVIRIIRIFLALMAKQGWIVHSNTWPVLLCPVLSVHIQPVWPSEGLFASTLAFQTCPLFYGFHYKLCIMSSPLYFVWSPGRRLRLGDGLCFRLISVRLTSSHLSKVKCCDLKLKPIQPNPLILWHDLLIAPLLWFMMKGFWEAVSQVLCGKK